MSIINYSELLGKKIELNFCLTNCCRWFILLFEQLFKYMRIKHLGQICIGPTLSQKDIKKLRSALKKDSSISDRLKLHSLLSGETRYKLVKIIKELKELCVCDMAEILDISISAVSHQLKLLRKEKIVVTRRKGQTIYYSIANNQVKKFL